MGASVISALFQKKTAELSRGYYNRGAEVQPSNRSKYNSKPEDVVCAMGMGIVQALLAILSGHVQQFSWREQGKVGAAHFASTSSRDTYDFTWDERDAVVGLYGGYTNGPTYQVAMLHLILCYLDQYHGGSERSAEVMERWLRLVDGMQRFYPRAPTRGNVWSKAEVAAGCGDNEVRPLIEQTADAMWFAMRYQLPDLAVDRKMDLFPAQVIQLPLTNPSGTLQGKDLFVRPQPVASGKIKARRVRQELSLELDVSQLERLTAVREQRMVGSMPVWHFPDPFDE